MEFDLSPEQAILTTTARRFLEKECPKHLVRTVMSGEQDFPRALWRRMAEMGWLGAGIPKEYQGSGASFFDLALLREEMGRALLPGPFVPTVILAARTLLAAGSEEQKKRFLPGIASGDLIFTYAFMESGGVTGPGQMKVAATAEGDDFLIDGIKRFVPEAHLADYIIGVVKTGDPGPNDAGVSLFAVEADAPGVDIRPQKTITGERLFDVAFNQVRMPKSALIGNPDQGWPVVEKVLGEAAAAECGYMVGGARWVLETAVDYAKQRIQFGTPIGSFQAIQHKCADMFLDIDGASFIAYYAAWLISEDDPAQSLIVSEAKTWCGDMYNRVTADGIQVLGGIGFTLEHDMHLYFQKAKALEVAYGDAHLHREKMIGQLF